MGTLCLRVPKQEIRQPLSRGDEVFLAAAVEPGRQQRRMREELVQLVQLKIGWTNPLRGIFVI
jgi:hypothetical protein